MTLQGKGFFIWNIRACESGNASAIAAIAQSAGYSHILVKIADGPYPANIHEYTQVDLVPSLVQALHAKGIQVWGWHYIYGHDPIGEARIASERTRALGLDGYVINAEIEFKARGMDLPARRYMNELRRGLPVLPIALSSFRFPTIHLDFPWKEFLEGCDYNMPQVYWLLYHDAGNQIRRSLREFQAIAPFRPIIPTGAAFRYMDWQPSAEEALDFLMTARALNLSAANFYVWEAARNSGEMRPVWDAIYNYSWSVSAAPQPTPKDLPEKLMDALNLRNSRQAVALYSPDAIHISAARTIQGQSALQAWYDALLTQLMPAATFQLTGSSSNGASRTFTWQATSPNGLIKDGNDTIGVVDGKIVYHYSFFTISNALPPN